MQKNIALTALAIVIASTSLFTTTAVAAPLTKITPQMRVAPGRFVVKVADPKSVNASLASQRAFVAQLAAKTGVAFTLSRPLVLGWLYLDVADLVDEERTIKLAASLKGIAGVVVAEPDWIARELRLPNDPLLNFMWHVEAMRLPAAWDITTGSSTTRVGVVDSGVINHEDLRDNFAGGLDFVSDSGSSGDGDGRDSDASDVCADTSFHGTHVAGTMVARGNNGIGVVGGNWSAKVMAVRALGCGGGTLTDINEGTMWLAGAAVPGIVSLTGADRSRVINLSLGVDSTVCDQFSAEVFAFLDGAGVISVIAAGNDGGPVLSPANCGGVISVAASGTRDQLTTYSSFGPEIDIVAPGGDLVNDVSDNVVSTVASSRSSFESGAPYGFLAGTSMAAPNVSGVVSLMLEQRPSLPRVDVEQILRDTGRTCSGCQGKPLIDAGAAVAFVANGGVVEQPTCSDTCQFANDGECDDGRAGAISAACATGTDCNDCDRTGPPAGPPQCSSNNNGCEYADDDICDEGEENSDFCVAGSDSRDCGRCGGAPGNNDDDDFDDDDFDDDDFDDDDRGSTNNSAALCGQHAPATVGLLGLALLLLRRRRGVSGR